MGKEELVFCSFYGAETINAIYSDGTLLLAKVINRLDLVLLSFVLLLLADGLGRGFFIDINIY